jgi:hypothetical protein
MNLEELFQFALNIEEASINPGKDSEGNPRNNKETKTEIPLFLKSKGVREKVIRKIEENLPF